MDVSSHLRYEISLINLLYSFDVKGFYRHVTESDPYWKWDSVYGDCYTTINRWNPLDSRNDWPWNAYLEGWIGVRYSWQEWVYLKNGDPNMFWNEMSNGWLETMREHPFQV